ncbi:MAG: peptidyl-prolyl cis-trans isomerase B [Thiomicrorhabdus sp.]|nr:MAG: peptidyl-prolyl cis-trans isomerase B [Thiomicrorhabdus sp.]
MTRRLFLTLKIGALALLMSAASMSHAESKLPQVLIETNQGNITLELYPEKAPITVKNFLTYVDEGFYNGTIFHRVIGNFMIQGGGFDKNLEKKTTHAPITNEADNGLRNSIGTIAMARTNDPHSATAQFFINVAKNNSLDFREKSSGRAWGYAVFGRVIKGMKTVNTIRKTKTTRMNGMGDVPTKPIVIRKISLVK